MAPLPIDALPGRVPVLVAGGGPVGLATAIELGTRGVGCLVVEPRATVSTARPRCKTVNVRTMEHLRRWGLADRLRRRAPLPVSWSRDVVFCTSLTGRELSRFTGVLGLAPDGDRFAETGQQVPQYVLEEVLREAVTDLDPCTLALGLRVTDLDQDADSVRVTVRDDAGREAVVTADHVVGCDGPRSVVRERIGAAYRGGRALSPNFGMVFSCPELAGHVAHGPAVQYWVVNGTAPALVGPLDRTGTWWAIAFGVDRATGEATAHDLIDAVAGRPVRAEVLSTDPWTARMEIVDRMRRGRVFLAGDAAHLNPPFGGHGLNTGIGDAVDLGWKLAAVARGWGGPALLDGYEAERRPIQERVIAEATANMRVLSSDLVTADLEAGGPAGDAARRAAGERIQRTKRAEFHALDLVLDVRVAASPVLPDGAACGTRLPHAFTGGASLYDLLGPDLTLLVLRPGAAPETIEDAARRQGVPLATVDVTATGLAARLGASLALVRPDQMIAWTGDGAPADPAALLATVTGTAPVPVSRR